MVVLDKHACVTQFRHPETAKWISRRLGLHPFHKCLQYWACHSMHTPALRMVDAKGKEKAIKTYGKLFEDAARIAQALSAKKVKPGDRVILCFLPGLDFATAFVGCLFLGVISVPVYPVDPRNKVQLGRFKRIAQIIAPKYILSNSSYSNLIGSLRHLLVTAQNDRSKRQSDLEWIFIESLISFDLSDACYGDTPHNHSGSSYKLLERWNPPNIAPHEIVLIQFSSGSTRDPQGIAISYGAMIYNMFACLSSMRGVNSDITAPDYMYFNNDLVHLEHIFDYLKQRQSLHFSRYGHHMRIVTWLPLYHDMGLIGTLLAVLLGGGEILMLSSLDFLKQPSTWFELLSEYKCCGTVTPNFGLELITRKISLEDARKLDLRFSGECGFLCGSEPVRATTLVKFLNVSIEFPPRRRTYIRCRVSHDLQKFESSNLRASFLNPSYGLAENTLIVSASSFNGRLAEPLIIALDREHVEPGAPVKVIGGPWPLTQFRFQKHENRYIYCVACGLSAQDTKIVIIEKFKEVPNGVLGEIWVSSPSGASGFWNDESQTRQKLFAQYQPLPRKTKGGIEANRPLLPHPSPPQLSLPEFIRTGDLGFLYETNEDNLTQKSDRSAQLFVIGRLDDTFIIRGQNFHAQDIEAFVEEINIDFIKGGRVLAFPKNDDENGLIILTEIRHRYLKQMTDKQKGCNYTIRNRFFKHDRVQACQNLLSQLTVEISQAVNTLLRIRIDKVVLMKQHSLPVTSSGKIRRRAGQEMYLLGHLDSKILIRYGPKDDMCFSSKEQQINSDISIISSERLRKNSQTLNQQPSKLSQHKRNDQVPKAMLSQEYMKEEIESIKKQIALNLAALNLIKTENIETFISSDKLHCSNLDSISVTEFSNKLGSDLGLDLPPTILFDFTSLEDMAKKIFQLERNIRIEHQQKIVVSNFSVNTSYSIISAAIHLPLNLPQKKVAKNLKSLWNDLLSEGRSAVTKKQTPKEFDTMFGCFLEQQELKRDPEMTTAQYAQLDPHQYLLLPVITKALKEAEITAREVGIFVGCCSSWEFSSGLKETKSSYSVTGAAPCMIANRISYNLDLTGPSMLIDTACSSALVAIDTAIHYLCSGALQYAVVAGVNLILTDRSSKSLHLMGVLSADGRCRTFDAQADGYGRGEGCCAVVLVQAQNSENSRTPLGQILGSSINQDGRSVSLTAPNGIAQSAVVRNALKNAGLTPDKIDYIECHGTGTRLGDPIEVNALATLFGGRKRNLGLGSVKTNLGHLEGAAGLVGIIKLLLVLGFRMQPQVVHFKKLNPLIDLAKLKGIISTQTETLNASDESFGGVSSFGIGGTNSHVVIRGWKFESGQNLCDHIKNFADLLGHDDSIKEDDFIIAEGSCVELQQKPDEESSRFLMDNLHEQEIIEWKLSEVIDAIEQIVNILLLNSSPIIPKNIPLAELGVDSLAAVELATRLTHKFSLTIPTTAIYDFPTIQELSNYVFTRCNAKFELVDLPSVEHIQEKEVVVISIAGRFPGSSNSPLEFWRMLNATVIPNRNLKMPENAGNLKDFSDSDKKIDDCGRPIPLTRWNHIRDWHDSSGLDLKKTFVNRACFIDSIEAESFDYKHFRMVPAEVVVTDPCQRLMLTVGTEAIVRSGLGWSESANASTGVFIGFANSEWSAVPQNLVEFSSYSGSGNGPSLTAGRLAYYNNFYGPALVIDTACSSSLVAVDLAFNAIQKGEITRALVGGVSLMLTPIPFVMLSRNGMLSNDGRCRPFDAAARGYVRGEGCGAAVLTSRVTAVSSKIPILAMLLGSAINQDGQSAGLTAPNGQAQTRVIRQAMRRAKIPPESISCIEAHGTGTQLGDPIEVKALAEVFDGKHVANELYLTAAKGHIGHLEGAAGIASFIKAVLIINFLRIPAICHLKNVNPLVVQALEMHKSRIRLISSQNSIENDPWLVSAKNMFLNSVKGIPSPKKSINCGVSAFSYCGTNAHVILQDAKGASDSEAKNPTLDEHNSIRTESSLERQDIACERDLGIPTFKLATSDTHKNTVSLKFKTYKPIHLAVPLEDESLYLQIHSLLFDENTLYRVCAQKYIRMMSVIKNTERTSHMIEQSPSTTSTERLTNDKDEAKFFEGAAERVTFAFVLIQATLDVWKKYGVVPTHIDFLLDRGESENIRGKNMNGLKLHSRAVIQLMTYEILQQQILGDRAVIIISLFDNEALKFVCQKSNGHISNVEFLMGKQDMPRALADLIAFENLNLFETNRQFPWWPASHPLLDRASSQELNKQHIFHLQTDLPWYRLFGDHKIGETAIVPGAGLIEICASAAIRSLTIIADSICLKNVEFLRSLDLDNRSHTPPPCTLIVACNEGMLDIRIKFVDNGEDVCKASVSEGSNSLAALEIPSIFKDDAASMEIEAVPLYEKLRHVQLNYEYKYKVIKKAEYYAGNCQSPDVVFFLLEVTSLDYDLENGLLILPEVLDGAFQAAAVLINAEGLQENVMLPIEAEHVSLLQNNGIQKCHSRNYIGCCWSALKLQKRDLRLDVCILPLIDETTYVSLRAYYNAAVQHNTQPIAIIRGLHLRELWSAPMHKLFWSEKTLRLDAAVVPELQLRHQYRILILEIEENNTTQRHWVSEVADYMLTRISGLQELISIPCTELSNYLQDFEISTAILVEYSNIISPNDLWNALSILQTVHSNLRRKELFLWFLDRSHQASGLFAMLRAARLELEAESAEISQFFYMQVKGPLAVDERKKILSKMIVDIDTGNLHETELFYDSGQWSIKRAILLPALTIPEQKSTSGQCWMITGGVGALGQLLGVWLLDRRRTECLILLTRRKPEVITLCKRLEECRWNQKRVIVLQCDITNKVQVAQILNEFEIDVIVHAAGLIKDSSIKFQSKASFEDVVHVKREGVNNILASWNLRSESNNRRRYLILFSSTAAFTGSFGQTSYAAANGYLDEVARLNDDIHSGIKILSLQWGPWEIGMAASVSALQRSMGVHLLSEKLGLQVFASLIENALTNWDSVPEEWKNISVVAIQKINWTLLRKAYVTLPSIYEIVAPETKKTVNIVPFSDVKTRRKDGIQSEVSSALQKAMSQIMGLGVTEVNELDENVPILELGIDSLGIVELRQLLNASLEIKISATALFEHPTIFDMKVHLIELLTETSQESSTNFVTQFSKGYEISNASQQMRKLCAVTGMACHFPKSHGLSQFWANVESGKDCMTKVPSDRWNFEDFYNSDPDTGSGSSVMYMSEGGFIEDIDVFDYDSFHISRQEALTMDPQQRLFLQTGFEALEDAGWLSEPLSSIFPKNRENTGVFVGVCLPDWTYALNPTDIKLHSGTGLVPALVSNRFSYVFGFTGPSLSVDTACSSSLVALDLALRKLETGSCNGAVIGGVQINLSPYPFIAFCKARMLSPSGRSKTFDVSADGYGRGEGVGAIVVENLIDEEIDLRRHNIWGYLRGSAIGHDGKSANLIAPNGNAQEKIIRQAINNVNQVKSSQIVYIETHGTGTALGDPIEVEALQNIFEPSLPNNNLSAEELYLGATKTNIGHLEGAAGIAGIIKTILVLSKNIVVPIVHFKTLNPLIELKSKIRIPKYRKNLFIDSNTINLAGVSSFGFGGALAHTILSGGDRKLSIAKEIKQLVFLFTGQGSKFSPLIGRDLYINNSEFQNTLDTTAKAAAPYLDNLNFVSVLYPDLQGPIDESTLLKSETLLKSPRFAQVAQFAIEMGLANALTAAGIVADVVIGHSLGEYAAAVIAGILPLSIAAELVAYRGYLMAQDHAEESVVACRISAQEAENRLKEINSPSLAVWISAINGPRSVVLGGITKDLNEFISYDPPILSSLTLPVNRAYHTPLMNDYVADFRSKAHDLLQNMCPSKKNRIIRFISTATGMTCSSEIVNTADYWTHHMKSRVLFDSALRQLEFPATILEIGPQSILLNLAKAIMRSEDIEYLAITAEMNSVDLSRILSSLHENFYKAKVTFKLKLPYFRKVSSSSAVNLDNAQEVRDTQHEELQIIARVFLESTGLHWDALKPTDLLAEAGVDSLSYFSFRDALMKEFAITIPIEYFVSRKLTKKDVETLLLSFLVDGQRKPALEKPDRVVEENLNNVWLEHLSPPPVCLRLICFAYGGGTTDVFNAWTHLMPATVKILPAALPGRASRFAEASLDDARVVAQQFAESLEVDICHPNSPPFAFLGVSIGAIIAFETVAELQRKKLRLPVHLFTICCAAPQIYRKSTARAAAVYRWLKRGRKKGKTQMSLEEVVTILQKDVNKKKEETESGNSLYEIQRTQAKSFLMDFLGAANYRGLERIEKNPEFADTWASVFSGDAAMALKYQPKDKVQISVPITAVEGSRDVVSRVTRNSMQRWRTWTNVEFKHVLIHRGDHYLVHEKASEIVSIVLHSCKDQLLLPESLSPTQTSNSKYMQKTVIIR